MNVFIAPYAPTCSTASRPCCASRAPSRLCQSCGSLRSVNFTPQWQHHSCRMSARARPVQHIRAEMNVGSDAKQDPNYFRVLRSSDGSSIALSNYEGKKPVVLFFYPKAATPGCTKEACAFRDAYGKFQDAGAEVFGISSDDVQKNSDFAKAQRLPFPLLTDQSEFLRKSFGIKGDLLGLLPGRQTYVLDKAGKVALSFNDQFNPEKHVEEALKVVKTLM